MIDEILKVAGALIPLMSAVASLINHFVRKDVEQGKESNKALLAAGDVMNAGAINVDKMIQLVNMLRPPKEEK